MPSNTVLPSQAICWWTWSCVKVLCKPLPTGLVNYSINHILPAYWVLGHVLPNSMHRPQFLITCACSKYLFLLWKTGNKLVFNTLSQTAVSVYLLLVVLPLVTFQWPLYVSLAVRTYERLVIFSLCCSLASYCEAPRQCNFTTVYTVISIR